MICKFANIGIISTYCFGSEKLHGYKALCITREAFTDELTTLVRERGMRVVFDAKLTDIVLDHPGQDNVQYQILGLQEYMSSLIVGCDGMQSRVREFTHPEIKPIFSGVAAITCLVLRTRLRISNDFHLPATFKVEGEAISLFPRGADGLEVELAVQKVVSNTRFRRVA